MANQLTCAGSNVVVGDPVVDKVAAVDLAVAPGQGVVDGAAVSCPPGEAEVGEDQIEFASSVSTFG